MTGADLLKLCRNRRGEFLITRGTSYVSGTLAARWIRTYPKGKRDLLSVKWDEGLLVIEGLGARLRLCHATGPTPKKSGDKGYWVCSAAREKAWNRNLPKYRKDAIWLPLKINP